MTSDSTAPRPRGTEPPAGATLASDAELADAYLEQKQDAALIELVRRHQIPVFRRLAIGLTDPDDAETVCEAVFVIASQRLSEWSRDTDFREWLFTVSDEVSASREGELADPNSPRLVDPALFFKQSVHRALHSLEPEARALLVAVDLEGQTVEQVAKARALTPEQVTIALSDARSRFTDAITRAPAASSGPAKQPAARPNPGEIIDKRYRVEKLLGEGGMAAVFRAEHLAIKRKVAIKTLHPTRQTQAMIRERFTREAEVLGRLAHPNFVNVSDFGESGRGMAYLVMELLSGRALSAELHASGKLHPARALRIVRQVCNGLDFAHKLGIIHRDIKPDNIVILDDPSVDGFAKILDLGVAATDEETESSDGNLYGTPAYMAPEQILGTRIDGRVDVYATGIMLYELLTGELPFKGGTIEFILAQQLTAKPPTLADSGLEIAEMPALQALLDRCLSKEPDARIASAELLRQEIDVLLVRFGDSGGDAAVPRPQSLGPATAPPPALPAPSARRPYFVYGAVAALAVLALLLWLWLT